MTIHQNLIPAAVAALDALNMSALRNAEAGELRAFAELMHHWQQLIAGERERRATTQIEGVLP